jgi:hypothetical protein
MSNPTPDQPRIDAFLRDLAGGAEQVPNGNGNGLIYKRHTTLLDDDQVIDRCRKAKNAPKFASLFDDGNLSAYDNDASDADYALIGILKIHTQDPEQIDRIMRRSALVRSKWDSSRGGKTWLRYSIDNALNSVDGRYKTGGSGSGSPIGNGTGTASDEPREERPLLTSTAFAEMPPAEPRRYIVEDIVPEAYPTMIYGDGGVAKSLIALSLGLAVASGAGSWLGRRVEPGAVLYLDFELDAPEQMRRISRLAQAEGLSTLPANIRYMSAIGVRPREAFTAALAECVRYGVKLLIVDSLGPALEGDAEASRDVISFYNEVVGPFRAAGVAPFAIDHQSKLQQGERYQNKRAFGSVFKSNLARSVLQVEATHRGDGELTIRIRQNKHNFGPLLKPFGAQLTFTEEEIRIQEVELEDADLAEEGTLNARERVYRAIRGFEDEEGTRSDVVEATGLADGTVKKELAALKRENPPRVWDTGRADEGQAVVTTKEPTGSGSGTYKGTGTGTGESQEGTRQMFEEEI